MSNNTFPWQTRLNKNVNEKNVVLERLSSGRRINSGKDDPAGLIVAERLQSELSALSAESRVVERLNSHANITDGHLSTLSGMTADIRTHVLAAANKGGLSDAERAAHQLEIDSLTARVQQTTYDAVENLNGLDLPDDGNAKLATQLSDAAGSVSTLATGGINELRSGNFTEMEKLLADATTAFTEGRGTLGAYQRNTLEPRANAIANEQASLMSAHGQIADADYALESSNLARSNVLTASSVEVLRIANHNAATVLGLLQ